MVVDEILSHNEAEGLVFDKELHKYFVGGVEHLSVTKFLKIFFPFDRDEISRLVAEKHWISQEDVLAKWDKVRDEGSFVHDLIDKYINGEVLSDVERNKILGALLFFEDNSFEVVASEIKVFSKSLRLAGTVDLIVKDVKGNFFLVDWKTNKSKIRKEDGFSNAGVPFDYLLNNKYYLYSSQLSLYKLILKEEYGIEIFDYFIVHLNSSGYERVDLIDLTYDFLDFFDGKNYLDALNLEKF